MHVLQFKKTCNNRYSKYIGGANVNLYRHEDVERLYQYKTISEYSLLNLKNNQIYLNIVNELNDPFEGLYAYDVPQNLQLDFINFNNSLEPFESISEGQYESLSAQAFESNDDFFRKNFRMTCFSTNHCSTTMWGHYADKHKGMCVEYKPIHKEPFRLAKKVEYLEEPYKIIISSKEDLNEKYFIQEHITRLFRKHIDWQLESEWRIVNGEELFTYKPNEITGIYFGLRTDLNDIESVKNATQHLPHIKFYKAKKTIGSYILNFEHI